MTLYIYLDPNSCILILYWCFCHHRSCKDSARCLIRLSMNIRGTYKLQKHNLISPQIFIYCRGIKRAMLVVVVVGGGGGVVVCLVIYAVCSSLSMLVNREHNHTKCTCSWTFSFSYEIFSRLILYPYFCMWVYIYALWICQVSNFSEWWK